jgi:diacylglycerol kinase family enzyme
LSPSEVPVPERCDVTLVHNVDAGDAAHDVEAILAILAGAGYRTRLLPTDGAWVAALAEATDIVAVLAGDGTVRTVVTEMVDRDTPVAILPGGTANNIARTLGIGGDAASLVAGWRAAAARPLDVWEIRRGGRSGRWVEAVGGGFMGQHVARGSEAEQPTVILGGALDRGRHLLSEAVAHASEGWWRLELDGKDRSGRYIGVEAMNIRSIGPQATFAPEADPGDGRIDLVLVDASRRDALLEGLAAEAFDRTEPWPAFPTLRGSTVRLTPPAGIALHVDDERWEPADDELTIELAGKVRCVP